MKTTKKRVSHEKEKYRDSNQLIWDVRIKKTTSGKISEKQTCHIAVPLLALDGCCWQSEARGNDRKEQSVGTVGDIMVGLQVGLFMGSGWALVK